MLKIHIHWWLLDENISGSSYSLSKELRGLLNSLYSSWFLRPLYQGFGLFSATNCRPWMQGNGLAFSSLRKVATRDNQGLGLLSVVFMLVSFTYAWSHSNFPSAGSRCCWVNCRYTAAVNREHTQICEDGHAVFMIRCWCYDAQSVLLK